MTTPDQHPPELLRAVEAIIVRSGPIYSTDGAAADILDAVRAYDATEQAATVRAYLDAMTLDEQHERCIAPGWEYATTEGQRKAWDGVDTPPEGDGWERNTPKGRNGWERFEYTEESYWRRRRTPGGAG